MARITALLSLRLRGFGWWQGRCKSIRKPKAPTKRGRCTPHRVTQEARRNWAWCAGRRSPERAAEEFSPPNYREPRHPAWRVNHAANMGLFREGAARRRGIQVLLTFSSQPSCAHWLYPAQYRNRLSLQSAISIRAREAAMRGGPRYAAASDVPFWSDNQLR